MQIFFNSAQVFQKKRFFGDYHMTMNVFMT